MKQPDKGTLTVFDLDDTLLYCRVNLYVNKADGTRIKVNSSMSHDLDPGDEYDYHEFRSSQRFYETSVPIEKMMRKFKAIRHNTRNPKSKIIILTARTDFDNKQLFLDALDMHGIYHDDVHVHRAGNLGHLETTPLRKRHVIEQYILTRAFNKVRMFDDCYKNLKEFLNIKEAFPEIKFEAWHVDHTGTAKRYKGEN